MIQLRLAQKIIRRYINSAGESVILDSKFFDSLKHDSNPYYPEHKTVYYNYSGKVDEAIATEFVKEIAEYIKNWVVVTDDEKEQEYYGLLKDLSENGREKADEAHADLYKLVRKLWGIEYYPFTTRD